MFRKKETFAVYVLKCRVSSVSDEYKPFSSSTFVTEKTERTVMVWLLV